MAAVAETTRACADARDVLAEQLCEKRRPVKPAPGPGGPGPAPTPGQTAGPGNAAVAVYQVRIQGLTFRDLGLNLPRRRQRRACRSPRWTGRAALWSTCLALSPASMGGPARARTGALLLGARPRPPSSPQARSSSPATRLFFTVANLGNPSLYVNTPYPYDLATVQRSGSNLRLTTSPAQLRQFIPPFGHPLFYFHTRDTSFADVLKGSDSAIVFELRFSAPTTPSRAPSRSTADTPPSTFPPSEYGRFGYRAAVSGTRISAPGGVGIYLPVPDPTIPRPPGFPRRHRAQTRAEHQRRPTRAPPAISLHLSGPRTHAANTAHPPHSLTPITARQASPSVLASDGSSLCASTESRQASAGSRASRY